MCMWAYADALQDRALCLRAVDARVYAQRLQVCEQSIQTCYVYYLI